MELVSHSAETDHFTKMLRPAQTKHTLFDSWNQRRPYIGTYYPDFTIRPYCYTESNACDNEL